MALQWLLNNDSWRLQKCLHVFVCVCEWLRLSVLREVHVLRAGEWLQRPVDEAVKEDKAGAGGPNRQDGDEGGAQIIDHLQPPKQMHHNGESISHSVAAESFFLS